MHEVKCPLAGKVEAVRRQQRAFFLTASLLSAIPVGCRLLAFLAVLTTPSDFPSADASFFSVRLWPIQIVLICLSLCGGAVLNDLPVVMEKFWAFKDF